MCAASKTRNLFDHLRLIHVDSSRQPFRSLPFPSRKSCFRIIRFRIICGSKHVPSRRRRERHAFSSKTFPRMEVGRHVSRDLSRVYARDQYTNLHIMIRNCVFPISPAPTPVSCSKRRSANGRIDESMTNDKWQRGCHSTSQLSRLLRST